MHPVDEEILEKKGRGKAGLWKKRKINQHMYTGDDASALLGKTADGSDPMYAYNVTNFKVSALINETSYNSAQMAAIHADFKLMKKLLMKATAVPANELKVIPAPSHPDREKIISECSFLPPVSVELCGSFATGLCLASDMTVDIRLVVPRKFYRQKDYMNQRWQTKKAFYASTLAHTLMKKKKYKVSYVWVDESSLDIGLDIACDGSVNFKLRLCAEEGTFAEKRLLPLVSNVRPCHVGLSGDIADSDLTPTPLYNHSLASNQIYGAGEQLTADWMNESDVIKQAMMLTKIWMRQRGLDKGFQSVGSFTVRMLMVYLLKNRKLAYHTTGHQTFASFLQKIASFDWSKPICLKEVVSKETLANHKQVSEYVFLDPTGLVNYCAAVSKEAMEQLQYHADETASLMLKDTDGSFKDAFIKKLSPHLYYDFSLKIKNVSKWRCWNEDKARYIDSCGDVLYSSLPKLIRVLRSGLANRITSLVISPVYRCKMCCSKAMPPPYTKVQDDALIVRFSINPDTAFSSLERGPPADDPSAEEFRKFWGDKSNLRRFMDGAICEAVVWDAPNVSQQRKMPGYMAMDILERHCSIDKQDVVLSAGQLLTNVVNDSFGVRRNEGSGEEEAADFQTVLFELSQHLKAIRSLPLNITDVMGMTAASRDTKLYHAGRINGMKMKIFEPHGVMCVLEGSKWPEREDILAINSLKMLMLIKMKESLSKLDSVAVFVRDSCITVFKGGYQFDVFLMNAAELARLRHDPGSLSNQQMFSDYVALPHISKTLAGLQSQHSTYGATARLLKRWAGAHLLSPFLPEPCTDLIAASLYVNPKPFQVPRCPTVAFQRCLDLIVHHDWASEPLVLNFNEEITDDQLASLMEEFSARRRQFPCMSILTPADRKSVLTKKVMPFMLKKVREVALTSSQAANKFLVNLDEESSLAEELFSPDLSALDVVIKLKSEKKRSFLTNLAQESKSMSVYVDPAHRYLNHIQKVCGGKAVIMYDGNCLHYIGLVWKPGVDNPMPLKSACLDSMAVATELRDIDGELYTQLDVQAMLQDLNITGKGVVETITVNSVS